jgi:hypothetical protein
MSSASKVRRKTATITTCNNILTSPIRIARPRRVKTGLEFTKSTSAKLRLHPDQILARNTQTRQSTPYCAADGHSPRFPSSIPAIMFPQRSTTWPKSQLRADWVNLVPGTPGGVRIPHGSGSASRRRNGTDGRVRSASV